MNACLRFFMDSSYAKSGVGIPAPLLQRVETAENVSFQDLSQTLAQDGKLLFRMIDGSLTAYGSNTAATLDAVKVDQVNAIESVAHMYDGPIMCKPRAHKHR